MPDMRHRISVTILCLLLLAVAAPPAGAEVCDDIDSLAEGWVAVADALEETAGDEIAELDVPRLERDVNALLEPTEKLGAALVELGNPDEEALGSDLLGVVDELRDVEGEDLAAYLVDRIDDIVDTLDVIVDYCDAVNE